MQKADREILVCLIREHHSVSLSRETVEVSEQSSKTSCHRKVTALTAQDHLTRRQTRVKENIDQHGHQDQKGQGCQPGSVTKDAERKRGILTK